MKVFLAEANTVPSHFGHFGGVFSWPVTIHFLKPAPFESNLPRTGSISLGSPYERESRILDGRLDGLLVDI
jgi:hypothetical protein